MRTVLRSACVITALAGCGSGGSWEFFQPDSATASSEWSPAYSIEHAIDGSGLPLELEPEHEHRPYGLSNHWTTEDGDVEGAWAWFHFDEPVELDTLFLWNHQSTSPPAFSPNYAITRFDLELLDADNRRLLEVRNLTARGARADAQIYAFEATPGVHSVRLTVLENAGERRVTGLAEVGFGGVR
jgi:hypothetical protein